MITGASEGIGFAYAVELAKAGFNLTLVSRSISNLEEAQAKINAVNLDVKIRLVPMDMSQTTDFSPLLNGDRHTVVINNVGRAPKGGAILK